MPPHPSGFKVMVLMVIRFGIKPLFWTVANGRLLVAAEMKAFKPLNGFNFEWDVRSIADGSYNIGCSTIFKNIEKARLVLPGNLKFF
jgi:asparagine synthetase B (glutamine-hydrolysing)